LKLFASGREADLFDLGNGRALRRHRTPGRAEREAAVMAHARASGFPVPQVYESLPDGMVLELIRGPTMLEDLRKRPWRLRSHGQLLATLHERLHVIAAPPALGIGAFLHLDLHPENVLLSPTGPMVIDWTNAAAGDPWLDVAVTWVILVTSDAPGRVARAGRSAFTRSFLAMFDPSEVRRALPAAAERRLRDPNVRDTEREAVRRLVAAEAL